MRRYSVLLVLVVAVLAVLNRPQTQGAQPPPVRGRPINAREQTREFADTFLKTLVFGRSFDAFAMVKNTMPGAEADVEATRESTERLIEAVRPSYGKMIGSELVQTKTLGTSMIRYDYLLKFERNAVQCRMMFYSANNTWVPANLWFTDDLRDLFEEAGK